MTDLDLATTEELVHELFKRSKTCMVFAHGLPSNGKPLGLFAVNGKHSDLCSLLAFVTVPVLTGQKPASDVEGEESDNDSEGE